MEQLDKIMQYTSSICEQVRWKKAHSIITEEIENHIIDQKNAYIEEGLDELTSIDKAIEEMGDPIIVGSQFDRTHRPKTEWSLIVLTALALVTGFFIRLLVPDSLYNNYYFFINSLIYTAIGAVCMFIAYSVDFTILGKYPKSIFISLLVFAVMIIPLSPHISLRSIYLQYMLVVFPTAFAGIIYNMRTKGYTGIILCGVFFAISAFFGTVSGSIFGMNPFSISGLSIYTLTCLILLTIAILKGWFNVKKINAMLLVYIPTICVSAVFIISIMGRTYRMLRFAVFVNPSIDPFGMGYYGTLIRKIINGAKFFGQGAILSNPNATRAPYFNTDYLLTTLIYRFGFISFIIIMAILLTFIIRAFILCKKQKSVLGKLISSAVLITFTIQVVIYVINNLGFQLISALPLPLIAYGGIGTIVNMTLIGIMLSVFKSGDLVRDKKVLSIGNSSKLFEIIDGKIIIDLGLIPRRFRSATPKKFSYKSRPPV